MKHKLSRFNIGDLVRCVGIPNRIGIIINSEEDLIDQGFMVAKIKLINSYYCIYRTETITELTRPEDYYLTLLSSMKDNVS